MDPSRIAELLNPYIVGLPLSTDIYNQLAKYCDLLLRWNSKTNLTAIRDPEQIVTRHFGESLFAARVLFAEQPPVPSVSLADVGSGAGFPGVPIKLAFPQLQVTLLESQNKKAAFLKELIRVLGIQGIEVYNGRAEQWGKQADVVTQRAVERFESVLKITSRLVKVDGRVCLLIGSEQRRVIGSIAEFHVKVETRMEGSSNSLVIVGEFH